MKTEYKYIHFVKIEDKPKTSVWSCRNSNDHTELGIIKWYPPWRQYCYFTRDLVIFNTGCLLEVISFIGQLKNERKVRPGADE